MSHIVKRHCSSLNMYRFRIADLIQCFKDLEKNIYSLQQHFDANNTLPAYVYDENVFAIRVFFRKFYLQYVFCIAEGYIPQDTQVLLYYILTLMHDFIYRQLVLGNSNANIFQLIFQIYHNYI